MGASRADKEKYFVKLKELIAKYRKHPLAYWLSSQSFLF